MAFIKKRYIWILLVIIIGLVVVLYESKNLIPDNTCTVQSGPFELALDIKGEVQGKDAVVINMPDVMKRRSLRIYQIKIKDLVPEGKLVKKGDWVATLDAADINQKIQSNQQELTRHLAEFNDSKIDSTIQLTKLREELQEFKYDLEYKKLELEQAKYESPAYQRKKQVDFNKTIRQMDKKRRDYELQRLKLKTQIQRKENYYRRDFETDSLLKQALMACRVKAPKDGMVMYAKLWGGRKLRAGDQVSRWNPTIAILPDMSVLVSETYVQEIDITKIAVGDSVEISIDALPNKKYSGIIAKIANIGQELQGFDTKVFKVIIEMNEHGEEIKPAMTTNNKIILTTLKDAIKIPRSCLFSNNDDTFVYVKEEGKIWKKRVKRGLENDKEIVIESGVKVGDVILKSAPENSDEIEFIDS